MSVQMLRRPSRYTVTMGTALALVAGFVVNNATTSSANGLPANKVAAAGTDIDVIGAGSEELIMSEVMKVSTTRDLMLHLSAECSILTRLNTLGQAGGEGTETDFAFGQVKLYLEIDGTRVPVATNPVDEVATDDTGDGNDIGEVVFCNRAYQRSVTNAESPNDGFDAENDYLRTRSANAFTWLALDAGRTYDDPANGNNVIQVDVFAEYDTRSSELGSGAAASCGDDASETDATPLPTAGATCADAIVGSRTLVVDTDVAANDEQISATDEDVAFRDR